MNAVADLKVKCRLCGCRLTDVEEDDFSREVCFSCADRPEAKLLGVDLSNPAPGSPSPSRDNVGARAFTPAEKALIRKVHGYMPHAQLLNILNERLMCDLGPDAAQYTMDQLSAEIGDQSHSAPAGGHDWATLRQLLAKASREGLLDTIDEQVINDFAIVFSLNAKQVLNLKDIVLEAKE